MKRIAEQTGKQGRPKSSINSHFYLLELPLFSLSRA
jgi:hypothetical protein